MKRFLSLLMVFATCTVSNTVYGWEVDSVTRQDPDNTVLIWDKSDAFTYNIYRSSSENGEYMFLGSTETGSFRDSSADYPKTYFYKVERVSDGEKNGEFSSPVKAGTNPQNVSLVSVIMYHNFVSDEDIKNGVEYEEYSIKPEAFEEDLKWLRDNGYVTITSLDLIEYLKGNKSLPKKAVIISIDDGSYGVYKNAWPLLIKYNMKADFNIIGKQIDDVWEKLYEGGTRDGDSAPYCTWEELAKMSESGEINLCSHTYGLHVYNRDKRIGMSMTEGESAEAFAEVVKKDYDLSVSCIEGWTGRTPQTVAYPYSKRTAEGDRIVLENTGYKILMAGDGARGTTGNYFVDGCDFENQLTLMSRPCRMDGTPISYYLNRISEEDAKNGVNIKDDSMKIPNADRIGADYMLFDDVNTDDWFSGSVYFNFANNLMKGISYTEFAPNDKISRAMTSALMFRLSGTFPPENKPQFSDTVSGAWYTDAIAWADENNILCGFQDGTYRPDEVITRQELAMVMYRFAKFMNYDTTKLADISVFSDWESILPEYRDAVSWAVANGIFRGSTDGTFNPLGNVSRAEMATVLRYWISNIQ